MIITNFARTNFKISLLNAQIVQNHCHPGRNLLFGFIFQYAFNKAFQYGTL